MRVTITADWLGRNSLPLFARKAIRTAFTNLRYPVMTRSELIIAGIIILLAVATFAILISYLGGIGAIICAILVAGFGQQVSEAISEDK